jgi:hypothetical protein
MFSFGGVNNETYLKFARFSLVNPARILPVGRSIVTRSVFSSVGRSIGRRCHRSDTPSVGALWLPLNHPVFLCQCLNHEIITSRDLLSSFFSVLRTIGNGSIPVRKIPLTLSSSTVRPTTVQNCSSWPYTASTSHSLTVGLAIRALSRRPGSKWPMALWTLD